MSEFRGIPKSMVTKVERTFNRKALARVCQMDEEDFASRYQMTTTMVDQPAPADFYHFKDNGSAVLAVAHLDTVVDRDERRCGFLDLVDGPVVYSGALDDRLGAYIVLDLLPKLGIRHDVLLTVGEEDGQSTARFFTPPKAYDWVIEFDRGGTDVVMYQYDDALTRGLVEDSGARVGEGIFTDICYLDHLGVKGFNWGVGYRDYHGTRSHAYLDETYSMVAKYLKFHEANGGVFLPHEEEEPWWLAADEEDPDFVAEYREAQGWSGWGEWRR